MNPTRCPSMRLPSFTRRLVQCKRQPEWGRLEGLNLPRFCRLGGQ